MTREDTTRLTFLSLGSSHFMSQMWDPSRCHISSLQDLTSAPLSPQILLEESLIGTSLFYHEIEYSTILDLSQLIFHEADIHTMSLLLKFACPRDTDSLSPRGIKLAGLIFSLMCPFFYLYLLEKIIQVLRESQSVFTAPHSTLDHSSSWRSIYFHSTR